MCDRSLRCRLLVSMVIVLMLGFIALAMNIYETRDQLRRSMMMIVAHEIGASLDASGDVNKLPTHHAGSELSYTLYTPNGELRWHSSNLDKPRQLRRGSLQDEIELIRTTVRRSQGNNINVPVTLRDGSTLMVSKEDSLERKLIDNLLYQRIMHGLVLFVPFCLIVAGLLFLLLRWTLRPVKKAVALAQNIGPDQPGLRIPLDELPKEVRPLAKVANEGLDRLAQAYTYEQNIVSDAAHALRTPLAVLDLHLQKLTAHNKADLSALNREFGQVRKLVNQLLTLAHQDRIHAQSRFTCHQADLARIAREAAGTMLPLFEALDRNINVYLKEGVTVQGDADLLREAIRNVLENALYHGAGTVTVSMGEPLAGVVTLDITDQGPGVPAQQQESMFLRFHKGSERSPGSGLGLAIVRSTLRHTGGDARFINMPPATLQMRFRLAT